MAVYVADSVTLPFYHEYRTIILAYPGAKKRSYRVSCVSRASIRDAINNFKGLALGHNIRLSLLVLLVGAIFGHGYSKDSC